MHKTLILSSLKPSPQKAVVHVQTTRSGSAGSLRLYNFSAMPTGILSLGILDGEKVKKAGLVSKGTGVFEFDFSEAIGEIFSCALVQVSGGKAQPILVGTTAGAVDEKLIKGLTLLDDECLSAANTEKVLDELDIDFSSEEKEEIEKEIDAYMEKNTEQEKPIFPEEKCVQGCGECQYRKAFFDTQMQTENSEPPIVENEEPPASFTQENPFYFEIKDQLKELFEKYPSDAFLTSSIPNSRWVKVDYESKGKYYVVGLLYDDESQAKVRYVCYGVPGVRNEEHPKELGGSCYWFPLEQNGKTDIGYWLLFQDAETGSNVEVEVS